jgi:2-polyprenyl-3-methyl-5-hydroxy-6-metoxy-1,4-benzoquinol methylase
MAIETVSATCGVCGIDDSVWQFSAVDRLHGVPGTYQYVECRRCHTLFANPRVADDHLSRIYPADYSPHLSAPAIGVGVGSGHRSPLLGRVRERMQYLLRFRWLYALKGMRLGDEVYGALSSRSRVLDVGCGSGSYLNMLARETGAAVFGVDLSSAAASTAREEYGVEIFVGNVEDSPFLPESFDLVTAWWYLEHVPRPRRAIEKIVELMKPGAVCVIGVPNSKSLNRHLFKGRWYHLDPPRHFNLWTPEALRQLCESAGLEFVGRKWDRTPWGLLGSLQYLLLGDNLRGRHRNLIRGNPLLAALLLPFTVLVSLFGASDLMVLSFRKEQAEPGR